MKLMMAIVAACAVVAGDGVARSDAARDERARQLYQAGRDAYNGGDFQKAYDAFKESFQLSHQPALLYNVASALQGLKRPHDAAEALRSYLRLKPDDLERPQIEERVRTLEEEQRLIDLENQAKAPRPVAPAPVAPPTITAPPSSTTLTASAPPTHKKERMRRRTALIVGITVGAVVVAGVAIGLAFGTQPKEEPLTPSPVGPIKSTQ